MVRPWKDSDRRLFAAEEGRFEPTYLGDLFRIEQPTCGVRFIYTVGWQRLSRPP